MAKAFRGSASATTTNGGNPVVDLTTISGLAIGDLVVLLGGVPTSVVGTPGVPGDYTALTGSPVIVGGGGTGTGRLYAGYKKLTSVDTSVTFTGDGDAASSVGAQAYVFSGADFDTSVTPTTANGTSTNPDAPSITPDENATGVVAVAASRTTDTTPGTPANYSNLVRTTASTDTNDIQICSVWRDGRSSGVAEDPPAFPSWGSGQWAAITFCIKDAGTVFDQAVLATTAPAAALVRQIAKAIGAQTTPPAALARMTGKPLAVTSAPVATLTVSRLFSVALQASATVVAALVRSMDKPVSAVATATASLMRAVAKPLAVSVAAAASLARATAKAVQAASSPVATVIALKAFIVDLQASASAVAALVRQTGKPLAANSAPVSTLQRAIAKALDAVTAPLATLLASKTFTVLLQASASAVAALVRSIGKPLAAASAPVTTLTRLTGKAVAAVVSPVAGLVRGIAKALLANGVVAAALSAVWSPPFSPALIDPRYLLTMFARIRGAFPSHSRGLNMPPKDRSEP